MQQYRFDKEHIGGSNPSQLSRSKQILWSFVKQLVRDINLRATVQSHRLAVEAQDLDLPHSTGGKYRNTVDQGQNNIECDTSSWSN